MFKNVFRSSACLLVMMLGASLAQAQIRSATIAGTVTDSAGAVIPNAEVVVTEQATNVATPSKSTAAGEFTVPYLPAGTYTVSVNVTGFQPFVVKDLVVATTQTVRVTASLTLSGVQQTVEVAAAAAQIQTDSSSVGGAVGAHTIETIPNITQNPLFYAMLQANVSPTNQSSDTTSVNSFGIGINGRRQFSAFGVNGGRSFTNDIQLDGLPIMGGGYNEASVVPNTEGLQEVRVTSNNATAEYGHGQAVVSMSTKSGTNEFHGQANYILRNEALNANTFANNQIGAPRPAFKVNEWGGGIGGPILKNKLFFFTSYDYLRNNRGTTTLYSVPTALQKVGNFSQSFTPNQAGQPVPVQIFNPYSVTQLGPDLYQRAVYPNAIIPNPNPYVLKMMSYYPAPNRTPDDVYGSNNYIASPIQTVRRHSLNNRIDYKRGNHSIYGSGGLYYGQIITPRPFGTSPFNGAPADTGDKNPYGQIGDTIILSPTLVLDVRYGYTRTNTHALTGDKTGLTQADYDAFGIPREVQSMFQIYGSAPTITPSQGAPTGTPGAWTALSAGSFGNKYERQQSHNLVGSVTKVSGKWTFKSGADFRNLLSNYQDLEESSAQLPSVNYNFGGNYTFQYVTAAGNSASQNTSVQQQGYYNATLFTGAGVWFIRPGANVTPALSQKYFALYSQNDWRATSKLTINIGARWDLQPGPTERYNRMSSYDFTKPNPFSGMGIIAFPGTNGYSRNLWDTRYNNWQPRVGLAYQIDQKTVFRGGFGITYLPTNTGYFSGPTDYGSVSFSAGTNVLPYGLTPQGLPIGHFWDTFSYAPAFGGNSAAPQVYGQGSNQRLFARNMKNSYAKQWNFTLERQLSQNWIASVGYNGVQGTHLMNTAQTFQNLQTVPQSLLSTWRSQYIASNGTLNPATQLIPNPYQTGNIPFGSALSGTTLQRQVQYLPFPILYGGVLSQSNGFSSYNALETHLRRAYANGLLLDLSYVFSKSLDYTTSDIVDNKGFNAGGTQVSGTVDLLNAYNNKKVSYSDMPHRFVATVTYDLPFGKGKMFQMSNRVLSSVLGGWSTGLVTILQSGLPVAGLTGAGDGSIRTLPNRTAGVPVEVPEALQHWYDGRTSVTLPCGRTITPTRNTFLKYSSCPFSGQVITTPNGSVVPDQYWIGNSAPSYADLRGPGRFNMDLSLRRNFRIRERISLEIAGNATNLLNHTQLNSNYNNNLGGTNLTTNAATGLLPGMPASATFGTITNATFDPRQITLNARIRF